MADAADREEKFALTSSRHFLSWLAASGGSIAFTTYQAGKLFLLGTRDEGVSVFERSFPRCMGIAVGDDGRKVALATQTQIQRFDNILPVGQSTSDGYDADGRPRCARRRVRRRWTSAVRQHALLLHCLGQ